MKKILVVGGTGAMGVYLVPELIKLGYAVDVVSMDDVKSDTKSLRYIQGDAYDFSYISELLKNEYDGIVDFMIYYKKEMIEKFLPLYLKNTGHYIFLSSYRVYADEEHPVKETSPRLLDVSKDNTLLTSGDYSIYKAEGEEFLKASGFSNYTIIRPAITYSKRRFQLVTLEMPLVVRRMLEGKKLLLPEPAKKVRATMSWAGDVAKMISRILLNKNTFLEAYSVCTAEHNSWEEVAEMYKRIGGLSYTWCDTDTFLEVIACGNIHAKQQLVYDRYFDRIMDNTKILNVTGMKQSELMPLEKGLALELGAFPKGFKWSEDEAYDRMDNYFNSKK